MWRGWGSGTSHLLRPRSTWVVDSNQHESVLHGVWVQGKSELLQVWIFCQQQHYKHVLLSRTGFL